VHGRPSHIFAANWTVKELNDQDFVDAYAAGRTDPDGLTSCPGPLLFRRLVSLTNILSDILDTFYTLKAVGDSTIAGTQQTRVILERAKPIQIGLKDWFTRLPNELRMDTTGYEAASSNGGLHLAYFATEITLHRCIIRSLAPDTADDYLSHICRSAAKTRLISAMDFVNRLRHIHLRSFWPAAARTNFALIGAFGILLRATAVTHEEEEFYRNRLTEYRWTLSVSCKHAGFLVSAIDSLDVATSLLRNVPAKPEIDELMASSHHKNHKQARHRVQWSQPTHGFVPHRDDEAMEDVPGTSQTSGSSSRGLHENDPRAGSSSVISGLASPATSVSSSESVSVLNMSTLP